MKQDEFVIRTYGKSELAMLYFPHDSKEVAGRKLREWLKVNPRLRKLVNSRSYLTPKEVRLIVEEVGEPFDTE